MKKIKLYIFSMYAQNSYSISFPMNIRKQYQTLALEPIHDSYEISYQHSLR